MAQAPLPPGAAGRQGLRVSAVVAPALRAACAVTTELAGSAVTLYSLPELEHRLGAKVSRLPLSLRIVLESLLRNCDGQSVLEDHVAELARWQPDAARTREIPFVV